MFQKPISKLAAGLRNGEFSSEELTQSFLDRIGRYDSQLNSVITLTESAALEAARAVSAQGYLLYRRCAYQLWLTHAGQLCSALRCDCDREVERGGRCYAGKNQYG
jgi:hypothetical protein